MTQPIQPQPYGQQPPPMPPPPPVQAKRKRFGWVALIVTALVSLTLGGLVGGANDAPTTTALPAPTATATVTEPAPEAEPGPTVTVTQAAEPKAEPEPKPQPEPDMGEGTYEVGKDVRAGQYKTTVPADSSGCYWERSKDDSGDSIITNDLANPGARVSVTIRKGEFFKSNGCGDWVRQ